MSRIYSTKRVLGHREIQSIDGLHALVPEINRQHNEIHKKIRDVHGDDVDLPVSANFHTTLTIETTYFEDDDDR